MLAIEEATAKTETRFASSSFLSTCGDQNHYKYPDVRGEMRKTMEWGTYTMIPSCRIHRGKTQLLLSLLTLSVDD